MTDNQLKQARREMREWLRLAGRKTRAERAHKWREIARDIIRDAEIRKAAAVKARATRTRRAQVAEKFKAYRPGQAA